MDRAGGARPYIERAFEDEDLRDNVRNAFESARVVYNELIGGRGAIPVATRVATDKEIQDRLKEALDELREAADRVQGKKDHGARNTMLLLDGHRARHPLQPGHRSADAQVARRQLFGPSDEFTYEGGTRSAGRGEDNKPLLRTLRAEVVGPHDERPIARCNEPGTSPSAIEMSVDASRIAPGFGAFPSECSGAHASPPAKLTS